MIFLITSIGNFSKLISAEEGEKKKKRREDRTGQDTRSQQHSHHRDICILKPPLS